MRSGLILALIERLIEFSRRRAWLVTAIAIGVTTGCAFYAGDRLSIDTDVDKLLDQTLPWRQRELAFDREFPQFVNLTVVVIDGATPDQAEDAAAALTAKLETMPEVAREVSWTEGSEFFKRNGILLLSKEEVRGFADQMVAAQPMIGTLAADPSLRGLFEALTLAGEGVERGETGGSDLDRPFGAFADTVEASLRGSYRPISWQTLLTGREPGALDLRRFVTVRPVLDYDELKPGGRASAAIRQAARELGLTPERGVRVRLTGPVPLGDEEFASVTEGAGFSTGLAFGLICLLLFLALRSVRLVVPILITLAMGLVITAAFAALMVHALNLISVAFAVLFIGIAVDFGIQFSVRYRSERHDHDDFAEALRRPSHGIGAPLAIAALTTAAGFLSFVPTAYIGVSDLGLISGAGMVVALALNLTVLPALLVLIRPRGERRRVGFRRLAPVDRFLLRRRRAVSFVALGFAAVGIALAPDLAFDFNPIHLKDPRSESVTTLDDLMADPDTTPYTIDVLAASPEAARELAERLDRLPEVSHSLTVMTFVPADQQEKLAILQDVAMLLGPTLSPPSVRPAPDIGTEIEALQEAASVMARAAKASGRPSVKRMAAVLQQAVARGPETLPLLRANLTAGLATRLAEMRLALAAGPVSLQTLPADLKREWVAPDGRARIQVFPKGDASRNEVLRRFVAAVRAVVPDATGAPISIQESAETIVGAFRNAGIFALIAIAGLLSIVLRKIRDVLLVLAPLVLAGLLTVATSVLADLPLNFANIIALPLLLGVGVAFDIYFVMNWRAGIGEPLQSSTARAVLFSALTTASAFGSLALSRHPGTSQMGILLTIALGYTLLCTFLVLPSLMGPVRRRGRK